jgi:hypothetical protein
MAKKKTPDEPIAEDPESQPRKGKRGKQATLPGVREHVVQHDDLDEAMSGLRELREEFADAGQKIDDKRTEIQSLLHAHRIRTYVVHGLKVELKPGDEQLAITKIKAPKEDAEHAA